MGRYILKRFAYCILVLFGVSILSFVVLHLAPGDPVRLMLPDGAPEEQVQAMREQLGLNRPLFEQYIIYMGNVLRGDLGRSLFFNQPNANIIAEALPATLLLTFTSIMVALLISIPLGIVSGVKRGSVTDVVAMLFALLGQSMSAVWLGILLIYIFAVRLRWLPPFGYGSIRNMIMPSITLGAPVAALITRMTRAGMIDVLSEDYILNAMSKGIPKKKVIGKYALKNVLIPIVTVVGIQIGVFLGGAIVTEQIFNLPGIGRLIVQSISRRDFPLVQSSLLVISAMFVFINVLVDLIYTYLDPRLNIIGTKTGNRT